MPLLLLISLVAAGCTEAPDVVAVAVAPQARGEVDAGLSGGAGSDADDSGDGRNGRNGRDGFTWDAGAAGLFSGFGDGECRRPRGLSELGVAAPYCEVPLDGPPGPNAVDPTQQLVTDLLATDGDFDPETVALCRDDPEMWWIQDGTAYLCHGRCEFMVQFLSELIAVQLETDCLAAQ